MEAVYDDGVPRAIWDVPWQEANGKQLKVSEEAKNFIRALYEKSIDPKEGGWKK